MPRRRTNNPLGVSDEPEMTLDPARVDIIAKEFQKKLGYIHDSFVVARGMFGAGNDFNNSVKQVRRSISGKEPVPLDRDKLQTEVLFVLSHFAKEEAARRSSATDVVPNEKDYELAARHVATTLKLRRGRSKADGLLRHHVEGLMALIQEVSGKPVFGQRDMGSDYDPQFTGVNSIIPDLFKRIDPSITDTQLVSIVKDARRKFAGKHMRFFDFFPGYGFTNIPVRAENYL